MKRNIIIAVVIGALVVGVSVLNASAWNHGGSGMGGSYGMMSGGGAPVNQKLLDETKDIRVAIAADQVELNALMAGPNPDSTRVRELSKSIATKQLAIGDKYRAYGYGGGHANGNHMNGNHMMGQGMMNGGYGICGW